jgi:integrase
MFYFGRLDDWKSALEKYKREWPYILQGLTPPPDDDGEWLTVDDLVNIWLDVKRQAVDSRELRLKTWQQYRTACGRLVELLGRQTRADALTPTDFEKLRAALAKDRGPVALAMDIRVTRMVFKYAYDAGLIDRPVRVAMLKQPSRRVLREYRQRNGKRMLEADEIRALLDVAKQPMKAMVLLGVNGGLGNTDIACLPKSAFDPSGWLNYPRPKTAVDRRIPLWPETVKSMQEAIAAGPQPDNPADGDLVFLTRSGRRWVEHSRGEKRTWKDALGLEFGKLLRLPRCLSCGALQARQHVEKCRACEWGPADGQEWGKLHRPGINFYVLRHVCETIGGETGDQVATDYVMGHVKSDMASLYRERISDDRLRAVSDHLHGWLFAKESPEKGGPE